MEWVLLKSHSTADGRPKRDRSTFNKPEPNCRRHFQDLGSRTTRHSSTFDTPGSFDISTLLDHSTSSPFDINDIRHHHHSTLPHLTLADSWIRHSPFDTRHSPLRPTDPREALRFRFRTPGSRLEASRLQDSGSRICPLVSPHTFCFAAALCSAQAYCCLGDADTRDVRPAESNSCRVLRWGEGYWFYPLGTHRGMVPGLPARKIHLFACLVPNGGITPSKMR